MKLLVIMPNWLGDAVIAEPCLALFKQRGFAVHALCNPNLFDVVAAMPSVDKVLQSPIPREGLQWWARWRYARKHLRGYSHALVLPNTWKSALLPWFAGITQRIGYKGEGRYGLLNLVYHDPIVSTTVIEKNRGVYSPYRKKRAMASFYAALAYPPTALPPPPEHIPQPRLDVARVQKCQPMLNNTEGLPLEVPSRFVVFAPGAEYGPAKRWGVLHYADFARLLLATGECDAIVVLGGAKDRVEGEAIAALLPHEERLYNFCGLTNLQQAMAWIARSQLLVCNDSGLMHVAAALDVKVLALYGPTDIYHTPPRGHYVSTLSLHLDCAPCQQRVCPLPEADLHHRCMRELSAQKAFTYLLQQKWW